MAPKIYCSFCSKSELEVAQMIRGPKAALCDECIELAWAVVKDARREKAKKQKASIG